MIIKGWIRTDGGALADYMLSEGEFSKNKEKNENIEIWEADGLQASGTLQELLNDYEQSAAVTDCQKPIFHVQLRAAQGEQLSKEEWLAIVDRVQKENGLEGHERAIVAHTLKGDVHLHVAFNRIDHENEKAAPLVFYKILEICHYMDLGTFGLQLNRPNHVRPLCTLRSASIWIKKNISTKKHRRF